MGTRKIQKACKYCDKLHYGTCWFNSKSKCRRCDKFGHLVNNKMNQFENHAKNIEDEASMFFACNSTKVVKNKPTV